MSLARVPPIVSKRQESNPHKLSGVLTHGLRVWSGQQATDGLSVTRRIEAFNEVAIFTEDTHTSRPSNTRTCFSDPRGSCEHLPGGRRPVKSHPDLSRHGLCE